MDLIARVAWQILSVSSEANIDARVHVSSLCIGEHQVEVIPELDDISGDFSGFWYHTGVVRVLSDQHSCGLISVLNNIDEGSDFFTTSSMSFQDRGISIQML